MNCTRCNSPIVRFAVISCEPRGALRACELVHESVSRRAYVGDPLLGSIGFLPKESQLLRVAAERRKDFVRLSSHLACVAGYVLFQLATLYVCFVNALLRRARSQLLEQRSDLRLGITMPAIDLRFQQLTLSASRFAILTLR